jgi:hypothetical protein
MLTSTNSEGIAATTQTLPPGASEVIDDSLAANARGGTDYLFRHTQSPWHRTQKRKSLSVPTTFQVAGSAREGTDYLFRPAHP